MSRATCFSRTVLAIPFLSLAAAGQAPTSNWDNVRTLAPGTEVRVAAGSSKPVQGKLDSVTDSNLVLRLATGTQSFPRPEIHSVSARGKGHRRRNVLIGMGAGTAAGIGIGGATANNCNGIGCGGIRVAVGGILGLAAGTVAGLMLPSGKWRQVYAP
jgi:hypothetical protein